MTTHTGASLATSSGAPLELLGVHAGVSVIDPATVLARLWYFDGKFLRAEGFRRDQQYVRSLVALSNRGTGHGVVHGFDVELGDGDSLRIEGGLALARSGKVVHLPGDVSLSVSELIARSLGELVPEVRDRVGSADFARCEEEVVGDQPTMVSPRPVYLLTVASTEALCGEEERFGQLCEAACATEVDRELVVEGARFRVRELALELPVSDRYPFDETHLRSRVATAYFERERREVPSLISGAGLQAPPWCHGAEAVDGEEVPLAVLGRAASGGTWLDMWTARRELVEQSPQRYWGWRMAMRPLDVFLAHVLQFQCQLTDGQPSGPGPSPGGGGCADEREALSETRLVLDSLLTATEDTGERTLAMSTHLSGITERLDALRARIGGVLSKAVRSSSGSLLLDSGLVTLPSGGYLPVDAARSVEEQVRALMGPGVDLRFCAVRADYVPEALQEAQHMERISLTRGIDDPSRVEEVDVLVPGGKVASRATALTAFEGLVRVLPSVREAGEGETGSALTGQVVGRDQLQDGWSWSLAAHAELPLRSSIRNLFAAARSFSAGEVSTDATERRAGDEAKPIEVRIQPDATSTASMATGAFRQRLAREATFARERLGRATGAGVFEGAPVAAVADRPIDPGERRPIMGWLDVEVDQDLRDVPVGGRASFRVRTTAYSRASEQPFLFDGRFIGSLVVTAKTSTTIDGGTPVLDIRTDVQGSADLLLVANGEVEDEPVRPLPPGFRLHWQVSVDRDVARLLSVELEVEQRPLYRLAIRDAGSPRHVQAALATRRGEIEPNVSLGRWTPTRAMSAIGTSSTVLGTLEMDESAGALDPGAPGRELASAVIDVLAAELSVRGRDTAFGPEAHRRFFEGDNGGSEQVESTTDWVMFHRRRTKDCGDTGPAPVATRHVRWFHALVDQPDELKMFSALAGHWDRAADGGGDADSATRDRLDALGFEVVTTLEFPQGSSALLTAEPGVRAAWSARDRGSMLLAGIVASLPTGDGATVDLARLSAATSAVADLVDASQLRTQVISEIPPEFQAPGLDGALFTVGYERRVVKTTKVLLVRDIPSGAHTFIPDGIDLTDDILTRNELAFILGESFEAVIAEFEDLELVNRDEVVDWWHQHPVENGQYVYGESVVEHGTEDNVDALMKVLITELDIHGLGPAREVLWRDEETIAVAGFTYGQEANG